MSFVLGAAFVIGLLAIAAYLYIGWQLRQWPFK